MQDQLLEEVHTGRVVATHIPSKPLRSRRLTRFSLRTVLVAITLLAVWLSFHCRSAKRQQASAEAVQRHGGWVYYDYEVGPDSKFVPNPQSPVPEWLLKSLGHHHFHDIVYVNMVYDDNGGKRLDNLNQSSEILVQLEGLPDLESLLLHDAQATDEGLKHVGKLTSLRRLFMWDAGAITDEGVAHLSELKKLEYLHLSNAKISDESLRVLAQLPKLHGLSLQGNLFTDGGIKNLRSMVQLRQLAVGLGGCNITDDGLVYLKNLKGLETLDLQKTEVTDAGLKHLEGLTNLKQLWLGGAPVSDTSWLQERLPNCKIGL